MQHILTIHCQESKTYPLTDFRYVIGRDAKCDIVISHKSVSRYHAYMCRITATADEDWYQLLDGSPPPRSRLSSNGVFVNGVGIQSHKLQDGDVLLLGNIEAVYRIIPSVSHTEDRNRTLS